MNRMGPNGPKITVNTRLNSHSIALAWFVTKLLHLEAVTPDDGIQIISLYSFF